VRGCARLRAVLASLAAWTAPARGGWGEARSRRKSGRCKERIMKLRVVDDIIATVGRVHRLAKLVARHDNDLAKQMKRSSASVGLNAGEGLYGRDGNRTVRLETAMCSGRETIVALRIAGAADYLDQQCVAAEVDTIDRIVATLYKIAYRR